MRTRAQKAEMLEWLKETLRNHSVFYIMDYMGMDTLMLNTLRKRLKDEGVQIRVVKNTLLRIALEETLNGSAAPLLQYLRGPTTLIASVHPSLPARIIDQFRKEFQTELPVLKVAWVEGALFEGESAWETLKSLKSREELIGDIVLLLQSPVQRLLSALSGGLWQILYGVRHHLEQKQA